MFDAWMALTRSVMVTPAVCKQRQVGDDVKLRHLAALHHHGADAVDAIQRRLQVVGGNLPKLHPAELIGAGVDAEGGRDALRRISAGEQGRDRAPRERAADLVQRLAVVSIVALDLWRLALEQQRGQPVVRVDELGGVGEAVVGRVRGGEPRAGGQLDRRRSRPPRRPERSPPGRRSTPAAPRTCCPDASCRRCRR